MHRAGSNETALVSEITYINNDENVVIAPRQGENQFEFQAMNVAKSKHSLMSFLRINLDILLLEIFLARYFNQRLLNFNQLHSWQTI